MLNQGPQKGKPFDKLPSKVLENFDKTEYLVSTKYDGNQIFIVKRNNKVTWFTSDWKQFDIPGIGSELLNNKQDFILVAEFMYNCEGKLGDRRKSAILTTLRTCFKKDIVNPTTFKENLCNIKVFDCICFKDYELISLPVYDLAYKYRLSVAQLLYTPSEISIIATFTCTGAEATRLAKNLVNSGWEGCMLVEPDSYYKVGKRVNHSIKLKYRKTADLLCIDVLQGDGKYAEMIGSLVLQDSKGRIVNVGSGLSDLDRNIADYYVGKIVEIEYEQLMDTYIQPTFVQVRLDKVKAD